MLKARHLRIVSFFGRALFSVLLWDVVLPRIGLRSLSRLTRSRRLRSIAARFRVFAARMGGVLIKAGQFLSSRLDVLPREITGELSGLQDEVGAERFEDIRRVVETEFGMPIEARFAEFSREPLASASIGQVHAARLHEAAQGLSTVVVKVQRPRIREIVDIDLQAIKVVGAWLGRFRAVNRHMNVAALIEELSRSLREETDYLREGKNAERFAANLAKVPDVRVPRVVWSHTTRAVLTLEDVGAIKITDYAGITAAGLDRKRVARRLLDVYLKQVFEDGFFHADPHPGNLFVAPSGGESWRLVFVDFGMAGELAPEAFAGLREALVALGTRDAPKLVSAYQKLDLLLPGADLEALERANELLFDRIWGKSTRDMLRMSGEEGRRFAKEFGELLYEMPFQVPENLILLGRCVGMLSGLATGLDPDFNVWTGLVPYARKLMGERGGQGWRLALGELGRAARALFGLPRRLESIVARAEKGGLEVKMPELKEHVVRLEHAVRKLAGSIILASLLLASTLLFLGGRETPGIVGGALSGLLLLWLLFGR